MAITRAEREFGSALQAVIDGFRGCRSVSAHSELAGLPVAFSVVTDREALIKSMFYINVG